MGGEGKGFTLAQVSEHNNPKDCWLVIGGKVICYYGYLLSFLSIQPWLVIYLMFAFVLVYFCSSIGFLQCAYFCFFASMCVSLMLLLLRRLDHLLIVLGFLLLIIIHNGSYLVFYALIYEYSSCLFYLKPPSIAFMFITVASKGTSKYYRRVACSDTSFC